MAEYDGKVIIKSIFDNKDVSSQMSKLENQIAKAGDKVATLNKKLEELGNKKIPTEEYKRASDEVKKLDNEIKDLPESIDKANEKLKLLKIFQYDAANKKIFSKEYEKILYAQQEARKKAAALYRPNTGMEANLSEYVKAKAELKALNEQRRAMITSGEKWEANPENREEYRRLTAEIEKTTSVLDQLNEKQQHYNTLVERLDHLEISGKKWKDAKGTDEYIKVAKEANLAQKEIDTLLIKQQELAEKERKVGNEAQKAGEKGRSGIRKIIDTCKEGVVSLGQLHKKTKSAGRGFSGMAENVKRFARQFGVMMLMMAGMKLVYAAIDQTKQGIEKLAKQSAPLAANISRMNQALAMLRNSLGTAFAPLINAVVPYLVTFCNWITSAINKVNQFLAALTGKSTWTKAITASTEVADSMNATADAAEKAKLSVQGFHELNNISSGSSGKGGGGGTSGADTYEELPIESGIKDLANEIKNAIAEGDWEGLGEFVGDKITGALKSIDWNKAYAGAIAFGTGLALFLNGLISPELFGTVGSTIASALNTAIYAALSFGENFDFENLGESIATGINDFFITFDFKALAKTIKVWIQGALDAAVALFKNTDFELIGSKIGEFLGDLDLEDYLDDIATLVWEAIKGGFELLKGMFEEAPLETALITAFGVLKFTGVGSFIAGEIAKKVAKKLGAKLATEIAAEESIADSIKHAVVGKIDGKFIGNVTLTVGVILAATWLGIKLGKWLEENGKTEFDKLKEKIGNLIVQKDTVTNFDGEKIELETPLKWKIKAFQMDTREAMHGFEAKVKDWFGGISFDFSEVATFKWSKSWFEKAKESFKTAFDGNRKDILDIGSYILEGILDGFVGAFTFIAEPVAKFFEAMANGIASVFGIHSPAKNMKPLGKNILLGIVEGFTGATGEFTKSVRTWFREGVKPWFTLEKWLTVGNGIKSAIKQKWIDFTSWFSQNGVSKWFNEHVKPKFSKEKWTFSGIKGGLKQAFQNAIAAIKQVWNSFATWLNEKLTLKWDDKKIGGKTIISAGSLTLGKIPTFANGGYPNQGDLFIANERGPELVGTVNGRAAVGSGQEITGISDTISRTSAQEVALLQKQNELLYGILNKEFGISKSDIFRSVRDSSNDYFRRTGRNAFSF